MPSDLSREELELWANGDLTAGIPDSRPAEIAQYALSLLDKADAAEGLAEALRRILATRGTWQQIGIQVERIAREALASYRAQVTE